MDEDATWYGSRHRRRPHCVRRGPSSPAKVAQQPPPVFGPCLLWPWSPIPATAELLFIKCWQSIAVASLDFVSEKLRCKDPALPPKRAHPQFPAHDCCGQTAVCIRIPLCTEVGLSLGDIVLDGDHLPSPKGAQLPNFWPVFIARWRHFVLEMR